MVVAVLLETKQGLDPLAVVVVVEVVWL